MSTRPMSVHFSAVAGMCILSGSTFANVFNMPAGQTSFQLVTVGNPGNAADTKRSPGTGSVPYVYQIGKFDVTVSQYCEFLNAVAKTDTYGLYHSNSPPPSSPFDCNIRRSGTSGNYVYTVGTGSALDMTNWGNRPVNAVSWGSAARFANWLANGQPTGQQNASTTEDGSYYLNGATNDALLAAVQRKRNALWVLPTDNEWYKAACYDPRKPGGAGYWYYPTRSDTMPSNVLDPAGTNNATYEKFSSYTIGPPYYRTNVGTFVNSPGPYGTFDQGGNVWQWIEGVTDFSWRFIRGGSCLDNGNSVGSRYYYPATTLGYHVGFRLTLLPEPATLVMFGLVAATLSWRPTRRQLR